MKHVFACTELGSCSTFNSTHKQILLEERTNSSTVSALHSMIAAVSHLPAFAVNPCSEEPDIRRNAIYLKYADSDQSCISVKAFDV